jgi:hypothetical protein
MRSITLAICLLLGTCVCAAADVSVGIRLPGISIGINTPRYPDLVVIPGYPVYYAPEVDSNFFFYDGLYWVYADDRWYASTWYNGPWDMIGPESVPYFVLRVPVRYYRRPPVYFRGWAPEGPPRWGEHWGRDWEQHRRDWNRWDRASVPAPAPLPRYQREYSGNRYPDFDRQHALRNQNYHYEPREPVARRVYQRAPEQRTPVQAPAQRPERDARSAAPPSTPRINVPSRPESAGAQGRQNSQRPPDRRAPQPPRDRTAPQSPRDERGAPPNIGSAGGENRSARPDKGAPSRETQPPRSREQSGERPGNASPRDKKENSDRPDRNDKRGDAGRPDRDR